MCIMSKVLYLESLKSQLRLESRSLVPGSDPHIHRYIGQLDLRLLDILRYSMDM